MPFRKIIDAFLFDGELTLLEHRLAETYDLVDLFVLVEAGETFRGAPKPMTFAAHREQFSRFAAKLRHVALPRLGVGAGDPAEGPWMRERVQRNAIQLAIPEAHEDDVLLLLDADEIASCDVLEQLRSEGLDQPRRLLMTRHYRAADTLGPASPCCPGSLQPFAASRNRTRPGSWEMLSIEWFSRSGVAVPVRALCRGGHKGISAFDLRRSAPLAGALPNAGRHLCFVDPSARPERKLGRVAHAEFATQRGMSIDHLRQCDRYGIHHRGWWYAERPFGPLPDDLRRLTVRSPLIVCDQPVLGNGVRRLARTWFWLRSWAVLPERAVYALDGHLPVWIPLAAPLLVLIDVGRWAAAACIGYRDRVSSRSIAKHQS